MHVSFQRSPGIALSLTLMGLALAVPAAHAQTTVFSNFGQGNTFDTGNGYAERGPNSLVGFSDSQGEGFTPTADGFLTTINIALGYIEGTNDASLYLADDANGLPGTVLENFSLTNLPNYKPTFTADMVSSASHPFLTAGTEYFLYVVEPGDEHISWDSNSMGEIGTHIHSINGVPYTSSLGTQGAFSVQVNPVPEASSVVSLGLLLTLGLGGVAVNRKRKANAAF